MCSTTSNMSQMLPWKATLCSSCWPLACPVGGWLWEPRAVRRRRNQNSVLKPDPSCPGAVALEQVCTVTVCAWYLLLPPDWHIILKRRAGPPVVWQDFPPHFSLVLLVHLHLFLPSQCANTLAVLIPSFLIYDILFPSYRRQAYLFIY